MVIPLGGITFQDVAPQLRLYLSFFVGEGLCIVWLFLVIITPQQHIAMQIIKVLKKLLHFLLEICTGMGKSAVILCLIFVWKRDHAKMIMTEGGAVGNNVKDLSTQKIIYCTRTHLYVTQLVAL